MASFLILLSLIYFPALNSWIRENRLSEIELISLGLKGRVKAKPYNSPRAVKLAQFILMLGLLYGCYLVFSLILDVFNIPDFSSSEINDMLKNVIINSACTIIIGVGCLICLKRIKNEA